MVTSFISPAVVLCTVLPFVVAANPFWQKRMTSECQTILREAGASENFAERASHGIHSIHIQELQKFNKNVTTNNGIPTINLDLTSKKMILPNAPSLKVDTRLNDDALETIDWVLINMDNPMYYMDHQGPLERIVHTFQMKKLWKIAKNTYDMIAENPPSRQVCKCATDVENNGIIDVIELQCRIIHGFTKLGGQDPRMAPTIIKEADWEAFKEAQFRSEFKNQNDNEYDTALFIYCQLNAPQT